MTKGHRVSCTVTDEGVVTTVRVVTTGRVMTKSNKNTRTDVSFACSSILRVNACAEKACEQWKTVGGYLFYFPVQWVLVRMPLIHENTAVLPAVIFNTCVVHDRGFTQVTNNQGKCEVMLVTEAMHTTH